MGESDEPITVILMLVRYLLHVGRWQHQSLDSGSIASRQRTPLNTTADQHPSP